MFAALLATTVLATIQNPGDARVYMPQLAARPAQKPRLSLYWADRAMAATKLSPKKFGPTEEPYTFDWVVGGFVRLDPKDATATPRFRVYNQIRPKANDTTFAATRLLLRLWESLGAWGADHTGEAGRGVVDVYLCWGGTPGGEALLDHDPQIPKPYDDKVATMYIYDLPSFNGPVEQAREVAHEYGHLVLPAIGGYSAPEDWSNGVLGERLFLVQLARDLEAKAIPSEDVFGLTAASLQPWLAQNVLIYRDRAAAEGPFAPRFSSRDKDGMDAFIGEATFLQAMLPPKRFGRTLFLMGSQKAAALIASAPLAMEEGGAELVLPASLRGKPIWIPVGKTKIVGAKVIARREGWAKVQSLGATITLKI